VLIYPEGELTIGGPIKPFLSGVGLLAEGASVPVVPVRLKINELGRPRQLPFLKRGDIEIHIGVPMTFPPTGDYTEQPLGLRLRSRYCRAEILRSAASPRSEVEGRCETCLISP
jgi:1-acyl-sn-glycerol-3-phosphate acyltransferase